MAFPSKLHADARRSGMASCAIEIGEHRSDEDMVEPWSSVLLKNEVEKVMASGFVKLLA